MVQQFTSSMYDKKRGPENGIDGKNNTMFQYKL